jgi:hypothetical protein
MNSETLINILQMALLFAVIATVVITLWHLDPVPTFLTTVSWNG